MISPIVLHLSDHTHRVRRKTITTTTITRTMTDTKTWSHAERKKRNRIWFPMPLRSLLFVILRLWLRCSSSTFHNTRTFVLSSLAVYLPACRTSPVIYVPSCYGMGTYAHITGCIMVVFGYCIMVVFGYCQTTYWDSIWRGPWNESRLMSSTKFLTTFPRCHCRQGKECHTHTYVGI